MTEYIPWTEKYRPKKYDSILLDNNNRKLFNNILKYNNFPNLLFHGPPGIGKTTTIINLIKRYQTLNNNKSDLQIIHLNASDERGVDIIRNNIYNFVNSDNLFLSGIKFVILDEVDYMTKIAQQALKSLIQEFNVNIRYCLICNYISKIDYSLQYEFIKIRFNTLPKEYLNNYLKNIIVNENINIKNDKNNINKIIDYFNYDIRSMINFIQSNTINKINKINIIENSILEKLYNFNTDKSLQLFVNKIINIEKIYNIDKNTIIKKYIFYILNNKLNLINSDIIIELEYIIHNLYNIDNNDITIKYVYYIILNN